MSFANAIETSILNHLLGKSAWAMPSPAAAAIALSTADPGETGAGLAEPADAAYARVAVNPAGWTVSGNEASNAADVEFAEAGASWGTLTHFAVFIDGTFVGSGELAAPKAIAAGDVARFAIGELTLTQD